MRVLCHVLDSKEKQGSWQIRGMHLEGNPLVFLRHEEFPSRGENGCQPLQELAREIFEKVDGVWAVCFETSFVWIFKDAYPRWHDIAMEIDHIIKDYFSQEHDGQPDVLPVRKDEFTGSPLIRVEPRPDVPWHRVYRVNRLIAEERRRYDIWEVGDTAPDIAKRISKIHGIVMIYIEPACVRISIFENLDWKKAWPAIERQIMSALMEFLRERDREIRALEQSIGIHT